MGEKTFFSGNRDINAGIFKIAAYYIIKSTATQPFKNEGEKSNT